MNEYRHTEMNDEVLDLRAKELLEVIDIAHNEKRQAQLQRELAHVAFEQWARYNEEKVKAWKPSTIENSREL